MKLYKISCSSSSPPHLTKVFLSNEQAYKSRCDSFREEFPIQIVCQGLTRVLAHNLECTNWRKLSHPALMLLHRLHRDNPPQKKNKKTGCKVQPPLSSSYFIARTHLHKRVASSWNHHNHFPNKTSYFSNPQTTCTNGKTNCFPCHQGELEFLIWGTTQNAARNLSNPFITLVGMVNIER